MKNRILLLLFVFVVASCKNNEVSEEVEAYCNCLQSNLYDIDGRYECVEIMNALKEKYKGETRILNQIVEETSDCQIGL